jgi:hypothetical protein
MKSPARNAHNAATTATTEKPFASVEVKHLYPRNGTYVPVALIDRTPDWACDFAGAQHGNHDRISSDQWSQFCVLFAHGDRHDDRIPPGDWLIYYHYNDDDGTHDHRLYVAARISN